MVLVLSFLVACRSVDTIHLDNNVAIRNYHGWVITSPDDVLDAQRELKIRALPSRDLERHGRPVVDLDGRSLSHIVSGRVNLTVDR